MFGHNFSTKQYIVAIFVVFALWCVIASAWYVCGVNNMCAIQVEAHSAVVDPGGTDDIPLANTQAPLMDGYDRSGAAGEIFIMLMIAFTLGALLGRILANSGRDVTTFTTSVPAVESAPRIGTPMHISEFTKNTPKPPIMVSAPTPKPEFRHTANTQPVARPPIIIAKKPMPAPIIHLGANTPKPAISAPTPILKSPERPKIKFNTSWSNPVRDSKKS